MHPLDWLIVGLYLAFAIAVGVYFTRKASRSTADFFVAGRSLPWWIAGTSIVATTFSTDTPLQVARFTREGGAGYNWIWWGIIFGSVATVFFFAKLWRRTGAETDVAFIEMRYEPGPARDALRMFHAFFGGVLVNCFILASVTLAATKLITILLGLDNHDVLFVLPGFGDVSAPLGVTFTLAFIALAYSLLSGMYGVAYTDLVQFVLAMLGSIWLAVVAYQKIQDAGGFEALPHDQGPATYTNLFPDFSAGGALLIFTFAVWSGIAWWDNSPGRFYTVQRLLSARSERESMLAYLWAAFCTFVLRSWPWILVGIASVAVFPVLEDDEAAYPLMINTLLGPGVKGVMVAAMLAAYMSTVDTHLNWGASYLVNDVYRAFLRKTESARHYVNVGRAAMILLTFVALGIVPFLPSIKEAYQYLAVITGGIGTIMVVRWYWWRVNAWSEISAIVAALLIANLANKFLVPTQDSPTTYQKDFYWALRQVVTIAGVTTVWVGITLITTKPPSDHLKTFYRKLRVPGPGWQRVSKETGVAPLGMKFSRSVAGWLTCSLTLFAMLLGSGALLFQRWAVGVALLLAAAFGLGLMLTVFQSVFADDASPAAEAQPTD